MGKCALSMMGFMYEMLWLYTKGFILKSAVRAEKREGGLILC